ncbi:unnamed protein product [Phytophthora lilii]|uniref:Unnamed protein product n=1 Tax=Phytophthora lilii TaxID=2077276 RepID=A0A9W6TEB4_9STRA|nr:unnamed protein product [Phytophthora lilii]
MIVSGSSVAHDVNSSEQRCRTRTHEWQQLLLRPDISKYLVFSKLRCLCIVSIALLATDIPRSGLGVQRLDEFYPRQVMPDTSIRFGPYNYPVRHIWRDGRNKTEIGIFHGLEGTNPVESANVWSYQYDTTSVGLRGAVELLNVAGYPDNLLYRGQFGKTNNQHGILGLNTTFFMLDDFVSAAKALLSANSTVPLPASLRFATKHNWVDRVHQYLIHFIKKKRIWSLHTLHIPIISRHTRSLKLCIPNRSATALLHPRFCSYSGLWKCEHPSNSSLLSVQLSERMDLRFQDLQRRYPDLALDVALISTHRPSMTSGTLSYTFFNCEEQEIVMLTRGRRCTDGTPGPSSTTPECTTVFVDDYRYERNLLQTNVVDWYIFIAIMRGSAQGYFWARLLLLYRTAFVITKYGELESLPWESRVLFAVSTVFKIPFQVIVYSSLLPVAGYVVALLLDGNFMDIFLDSYWSSLEGATNFEVMSFLNSAVTQMRTVWLMALLVDLVVLMARKPRDDSGETLPGIRGLIISFTSALTVVGPYKQTQFRNSEIVEVIRLPNIGQIADIVQSSPQWYFNESTYFFDDSITMLTVCIAAVVLIASTARLVVFLIRVDQGLVLMSTLNVPYGTESLWPTSSLSIRFNALTSCSPNQHELQRQASIAKVSPGALHDLVTASSSCFSNSKILPTPSMPIPSDIARAVNVFGFKSKLRPWRFCNRIQIGPSSKRSSQLSGGLRLRTTELHSILLLMNIAMMTDPWNYFWLRFIGVRLYLHRIRTCCLTNVCPDTSVKLVSYAVILPYSEDEMEERTGMSSNDFQLLDWASSRDIPMYILLQSG